MAIYVSQNVVVEAEEWQVGKEIKGVHARPSPDANLWQRQVFHPHVHMYETDDIRAIFFLETGDWVVTFPDNKVIALPPDLFRRLFGGSQ